MGAFPLPVHVSICYLPAFPSWLKAVHGSVCWMGAQLASGAGVVYIWRYCLLCHRLPPERAAGLLAQRCPDSGVPGGVPPLPLVPGVGGLLLHVLQLPLCSAWLRGARQGAQPRCGWLGLGWGQARCSWRGEVLVPRTRWQGAVCRSLCRAELFFFLPPLPVTLLRVPHPNRGVEGALRRSRPGLEEQEGEAQPWCWWAWEQQ